MDVLPPPDYPPINQSEYPRIPTRTPSAILEKMQSFCVSGDFRQFRSDFDAISSSQGDFDVCDLSAIMVEAIERDNALFIKELLDRGLPMDPVYASQAIRAKAKNALSIFIQSGWNINQPISQLKPPVLG